MKRILKYIVLVVVATILGYIALKIHSGVSLKKEIEKSREVIPFHCFYTLNEKHPDFKGTKKRDSYVLVFFSPGCDHCEYEIESIIHKADSFNNVIIFLVSDQPVKNLKAISEQYELQKYPQIEILYGDYECTKSVYGIIMFPTTFIYDRDFRLTKIFRGETSASAILKASGKR
jgi:thiol-disulfide isomerase/thioredoxin